MPWDSMNSWKAFSADCGCIFLAKSWDSWSSGQEWWSWSQLVRRLWWMRQNFVAQFIQLRSVGCATCSWVLSWRIGPSLLMNADCRHCSLGWISSISWVYFSDVMVSPGFRSCSGSDRQQTTKQGRWPFFHANLALGSALEPLLSSATQLVITSRAVVV